MRSTQEVTAGGARIEAGFSLIEVLVAVFMAGLVFLMMAQLLGIFVFRSQHVDTYDRLASVWGELVGDRCGHH